MACLVLVQSQSLAGPALLVCLPLGHLVGDGVLKLLDLSTQLIHHLGVDKDVSIVQVLQQEKGPSMGASECCAASCAATPQLTSLWHVRQQEPDMPSRGFLKTDKAHRYNKLLRLGLVLIQPQNELFQRYVTAQEQKFSCMHRSSGVANILRSRLETVSFTT